MVCACVFGRREAGRRGSHDPNEELREMVVGVPMGAVRLVVGAEGGDGELEGNETIDGVRFLFFCFLFLF